MIVSQTVGRLGFDPLRLGFLLRTAVAAFCAVAAAWAIGLEHPQWSGMTVWAASVPFRGALVEKSIFRILGTILGAAFGVVLLFLSGGEPWFIVPGLALWIGLCVGAGNILRGFVAYGVMLAGYSAAMVVLLHSAHTTGSLAAGSLAIGIDRILTVLVGVLIALIIGWIFAAPPNREGLNSRVRWLSGRILSDLAERLTGTGPDGGSAEHAYLVEMAGIEEGLDVHAAGSLRSREMARSIRRILLAQVSVLLRMRHLPGETYKPACIEALRAASVTVDGPARPDEAATAIRRAVSHCCFDRGLRDALDSMADALAGLRAVGGGEVSVPRNAISLHRDWIGARHALLRAAAVMFVVGLPWLATGAEAGAFMMLGTAVMITVFSTFENPAQTTRYALVGQFVGASAALACRWIAWPLASGPVGMTMMMLPFIMLGGFLLAHRRTTAIGFDYNMVLLLMLQPVWPLAGSFGDSLISAIAIVLGPLIALLSYRWIFPVDGRRRLGTLVTMMVHEIEAMASRGDSFERRSLWRARLYHRVLRLVSWSEKTGSSTESAAGGSFAVLLLGTVILQMHEMLAKPDLPPRTARRLKATLARLRHVGNDPLRAAHSLDRLTSGLADRTDVDHALLKQSAVELRRHIKFFQFAALKVF